MSTFTCHDQCEKYCKDPCKEIVSELQKKIKSGSPQKWLLKEKILSWQDFEKKNVVEALSKLSDVLLQNKVFEIYRMEKSETPANPATNGDAEPHPIILYNIAFSKKFNLERVLAHEFAHLYYQKMLKYDK